MRIFVSLFLVCFSSSLFAAEGFSISATRIIYPSNQQSVSFEAINSTKDQIYLIESWVSEATNNERNKNFTIIPPLFRLDADRKNQLRIMYNGTGLPTDRESLFWLNVKAIPGIDKNKIHNNMLIIAAKMKFKLLYRPDNISMPIKTAMSSLKWQLVKHKLIISNPTPYYMTIIQVKFGNTILKNKDTIFLAPFSQQTEVYQGNVPNGIAVHYTLINDFGGKSEYTTQIS